MEQPVTVVLTYAVDQHFVHVQEDGPGRCERSDRQDDQGQEGPHPPEAPNRWLFLDGLSPHFVRRARLIGGAGWWMAVHQD